MKIIRENINFQRGLDPKDAMGTGMKNTIQNWYKSVYDHKDGDDTSVYYLDQIFLKIATYHPEKLGYAVWLVENNFISKMYLEMALNYAAEMGNDKIIEVILKRGVNIKKLHSPLLWAASKGDINTTKLLLEYDVDVKKNHNQAIQVAAKSNHLNIIKLILDYLNVK